jgi:peptidoglycan/xylan/chitin deacetylase (PgdA/CDA1 family)
MADLAHAARDAHAMTGVSRRRFLVGAAALAAEVTVLASCSSSGSRAISKPPVTTTPLRSAPTTTPPLASKLPLEALFPPVPRFVRAGPTTRPRVALTVDDLFGVSGADNLTTLLDIAKAKNVQFTFFPTGGALETHLNAGRQDVWRRAISEGHEIGNHGYTHRAFTGFSDQELRSELTNTQQMLDRVLAPDLQYPMRLARPPGGAGGFVTGGDPRIKAVLTQLGLSMVMWTIDSNHTAGNASYLEKIVGSAANGSIVLTHFTTFAVGNFPVLIDRLRNERHLEPTNVGGLFA